MWSLKIPWKQGGVYPKEEETNLGFAASVNEHSTNTEFTLGLNYNRSHSSIKDFRDTVYQREC